MVRTVREPNPTTPQLLRTSTSRSAPHNSPSRTQHKPREVLGERNDNTLQPRPVSATAKPGPSKLTTASPSRLSLSRFIAKSPRGVRVPSSSPMPRLAGSPGGSPLNASSAATSTAWPSGLSSRPWQSMAISQYVQGQDETLLMDVELPGMSMAFDTTDESGAETDTEGPGVLSAQVRGGLMTPAPSQEVRIQDPSPGRRQQTTKRLGAPPAASVALRPVHTYARMPTPPMSQNQVIVAEPAAGDVHEAWHVGTSGASSSSGKRSRPRVSTAAISPRRASTNSAQTRATTSTSSTLSSMEPSPNPRRRKTPRLSDERMKAVVEVVIPVRGSGSRSRSPGATPKAARKGRKSNARVLLVAPVDTPRAFARSTAEPAVQQEMEDAETACDLHTGTPAPAPRARTTAPPATAPAANRRRRKSIVMPRASTRKRLLSSHELPSKSQTPKPTSKLSKSTSTSSKTTKARRASTTATFKTPGRRRTSGLSTEFTALLEEERSMSPRIHDEVPLGSNTSDSDDIMMLKDGDSDEEDQEVVMRGERWERPTRDSMRKVTDRALGWRPPTARKTVTAHTALALRDSQSQDEDADEMPPYDDYDAPAWSDDGSDGEGEGIGEDTFVGVKGRRAGMGLGLGLRAASGSVPVSVSDMGLTHQQDDEREEDEKDQEDEDEEEDEEDEGDEEDEEEEAGRSGTSGELLAAASPYVPPRRSTVTFSMSPVKPPAARMVSRSPVSAMGVRAGTVRRLEESEKEEGETTPFVPPQRSMWAPSQSHVQSQAGGPPSPGGFASSSPFADVGALPATEEETVSDADVMAEGQLHNWALDDWEELGEDQPTMVLEEREEVDGEMEEAGKELEKQEEQGVDHYAPSPSSSPASPPGPETLAASPRAAPAPSLSPSPAPAQSPLAGSTATSHFAFAQHIRSPTPPRPYASAQAAAPRMPTPFVLILNREEEEGGHVGIEGASEQFDASTSLEREDMGEMDDAAEVGSEYASTGGQGEDDEEEKQDELLQRATCLVSRLSVPLDFTVPTSSDDTTRTTAFSTPTRLAAPVSPAPSQVSRVSGGRSCTPAPEVKIEAASPVAGGTPRATRSLSVMGKSPSASPRGLSSALGSTRRSLSRSPSAGLGSRERTPTSEISARQSASPARTPRAFLRSPSPELSSAHPSPQGKTPISSSRPAEREVIPSLVPLSTIADRTLSASPHMRANTLRADSRDGESTPGVAPPVDRAWTTSASPAPVQMSTSPTPAGSPSMRTRSRSRSRSRTRVLTPAPAGTTTPAFSPAKMASTTPAGSPMQTRSRARTPGMTEMLQLVLPVLTPRRGNSVPASPMRERTPVYAREEEPERLEGANEEGGVEDGEPLSVSQVLELPVPQKEALPIAVLDACMGEAADDLDEADAHEIDASFFEAHIPSQTLLQPSLSPFSFSGSSPCAYPDEFFEGLPIPALQRRKSVSLPFTEQEDNAPGPQPAMEDEEFGGDMTVDGDSGAWDLSGEGSCSHETVRGREEEEQQSGDDEMENMPGEEEDGFGEGNERGGGQNKDEQQQQDEGEKEERKKGGRIVLKLVEVGSVKAEPGPEAEDNSVESAQVAEDTSLELALAEDQAALQERVTERSLAVEPSPDCDDHRSPSPAPAEVPTTPARVPATPAGATTPLVYPSLAHIPSPLTLAPAPAPAPVSTSPAFPAAHFFRAPATSSADASSSVMALQLQRGHTSDSISSSDNSLLEQMLAKRKAPHSKLSQQVLPWSSPAPSNPAEEDYERSDMALSPEPEADRSVRVRKARKSLHDELAAVMGAGAGDEEGSRDDSYKSVVEVSSLDPRAAARAAAILKLNHAFIERGILPPSQDPNASTSSQRKSTSRIDKRELLHEAELELVAHRRSRSQSTSRGSGADEWVEPAQNDLEREMRQAREASVMTFRTDDYPVPGGYMKTPGTAKRLRSQHREYLARESHTDGSGTPTAKGKGKERAGPRVKDRARWGVAEWKHLERVYTAEKELWIKEREVKSLPRSPVAAAPGTPGTPAMPGGLVSWARRATMSIGTPTKPKAAVPEHKAKEWDGLRVVERFLREEGGADGRGEEWDSEVILLRVHAIERRIHRLRQNESSSADLETPAAKKARTSPRDKRTPATDETFEGHTTMLQTPFVANVPGGVEPPSTIRRVLGFIWGKKATVPGLAQSEAREAAVQEEDVVEQNEETAAVREKGKGLMREFEAVREKDMREVSREPAPSRPSAIPTPLPTPALTANALTASTSSSYSYSHSTSAYSYPISSMYTRLSGTRLYPPLDPPLSQRTSAIAKLFPEGVKPPGLSPPPDKGKGREVERNLQKSRSGSVKDLAKAFEGK